MGKELKNTQGRDIVENFEAKENILFDAYTT